MSRNFNSNMDWFNQPNSLTYDFGYLRDDDEERERQLRSRQGYYNTGITPTLFGGVSTDNGYSDMATMLNDGDNKTSNTIGIGKDILDIIQGFGGGGGSYTPLIGSVANASKTAIDGGSWRDDIPQSFFGIDNENDSDVEQSLKGAAKGAAMGTSILPGWGTAIGAVLGLGASFLDDI